MSNQTTILTDCTSKCQSVQHGDILTAAITKRCITDSDLCSYLIYTCSCGESVKDTDGKTVLHAAASCGRTDLVRWLVENRHANINDKDKESGYTALHRSIFYGKIDTTVALIKLGANLSAQDANGLTFLEHAMMDRFRPSGITFTAGELFTWGTNSNNSLGSQLPRTVPETMAIFHKEYPNENVQQILINEFHSVILTDTGSVYSCGHGQGGRLGTGIQHTELIPKPIKFPVHANALGEPVQITSCSIARDHSLFLSSNGDLFSCGLNVHNVLGIIPPPAKLLVPKQIKYSGNKLLSYVATGNYHSLVWNQSGIFTWGLNAGQLGHQLINPDSKYILTPRRVNFLNAENTIKLVCASTGATVLYTEKGDVYVFHEYQCRKIASRILNLTQIAVTGGKLNHTLDPELSNKNRELKVAALTNTGNFLLWQENDPVLRRCVFSINRSLHITQIAININHLLFVTNDGEAFKGESKPRRKNKPIEKEKQTKSEFHKFLEKDECVTVKLEKISRIHRALSIQSDSKGHNFGVVQVRPYNFLNCYDISESTMFENMYDLLTSADACDNIVDVEINISGRIFPAHRYILASKSNYFANLFSKNRDRKIELKGYQPAIFEEFLKYIYTGTTELIQIGELKNECLIRLCTKPLMPDEKENVIFDENETAFEFYSKHKPENDEKISDDRTLHNPVRMLHEMAKRFEVIDLQKILSHLDMIKHAIRIKKDGRAIKNTPIIFNKYVYPELCDIEIHCRDDRVLRAHKCILFARLDYFGSMFSSRWTGGDTSKVTMPFAKGVVEALLEFLYTDSLNRLEDIDHLFKIIIMADQFFVTRLKDQCENILSDLLTMKNAIQLLTFADAYNADNLKENCFEFIQQNMTSFLELRLLDDIESHLLKELSEFYQIKRHLDCRVITPYSTAVSDEDILLISSMCPVDISEKKDKSSSKEKSKGSGGSRSGGKRIRSHKNSNSEKSLSRSFENDTYIHDNLLSASPDTPHESPPTDRFSKFSSPRPLTNRIKAISITNEIVSKEDIELNFTTLSRKSESESLNSSFQLSPNVSGFHNRTPYEIEIRPYTKHLSQKQRKRLSSESSNQVSVETHTVTESPKNPWKILQDPVSPINSPISDNIETIMSSEKKQKENLVKITNRHLAFTQLEDKAIDELRKFYSVENIEEEVILIERVSMGAVALPTWVPMTK